MPINPYIEMGIRKRSKERKLRKEMFRKGYSEYEIYSRRIPDFSTDNVKYEDSVGGRVKRVGIWTITSAHYSGGRIHLYQYLWCLANMGCECWLITDRYPTWARDYPQLDNIHIHIGKDDLLPGDLDICMSDSKGEFGIRAMEYAKEHGSKLATMNFETPNWINSYVPDTLPDIGHDRMAIYRDSDIMLANSELSLKYAIEYSKRDERKLAGVLPPAINTFREGEVTVALPRRKYALWSGRGQKYKQADVAFESVMSIEKPFDLVMFGTPPNGYGSSVHKIYGYKNYSDADKFYLMENAHFVIAPSLFEGFGMVPSEALSVGTPCVVYDLPVLRWAYGDRLEYVKWNRPEAFKAKVRELASKPKKKVERARKYVIQSYSIDAMQERIERFPYHAMNRKSVSAHMIAYSCAGLAPYALESVYPHVDEIIIAYGPVPQGKGWPEDGTLEAIRAFDDPDKKITLEVRDAWEDKLQMRQWCADRVTGNYHLELDGDEIWTGLDNWEVDFGTPRWVNFWHGPGHYITEGKDSAGRRWGRPIGRVGSGCPHWRWSWWRPRDRFIKHTRVTAMPKEIPSFVEHNHTVAKENPDTVIWHLGHALPRSHAEKKLAFYEARDGAPDNRKRAWLDWNGETGECGDGIVRKVVFKLPDIVQRAFNHLETWDADIEQSI